MEFDSPIPCTVIYAVICLFFMLISGVPFLALLMWGLIYAAVAWLLFWGLIKTKNSPAWWAVAVIGVIGLTII